MRWVISFEIGVNLETANSARIGLNFENSFPAFSESIFSGLSPERPAKMFIKFFASGLFSNPFNSLGRGSESVFAFLIFFKINSALSVKFIRLISEESDLDIFLVPSLNDITLVATPSITGSVMGKKSVLKSLLNFVAISLVSSKCCF